MLGELIHDPEHGWIGKVDWSTQDVWKSGRRPSPLADHLPVVGTPARRPR